MIGGNVAKAVCQVRKNLTSELLLEAAIKRQEGVQANTGALVVETGVRTGRSPKDRFIVKDESTALTVDWGDVNQPVEPELFNALWVKVSDYLSSQEEIFLSELQVGADSEQGVPVKVLTELAWHSLFARHLFISPSREQQSNQPAWEICSAPGFHADPRVDSTASNGAVMINFTLRRILICGIHYAGEMKKAMFTVMNYLMPENNILPMHCAANVSSDGVVTLFFGLSGTGKTTLSADSGSALIGDDEHGWTDKGVFNFEGGCYAKCIHLSKAQEPEIWGAVSQTGAILENVCLINDREPNFDDDSLTQNTRGAYSRSFLSSIVEENSSHSPGVVLFLACDCYGVLPPIASLTKDQAAYYFLSGYTALMGSTEVGSTAAIQPTFSTCFGAPFFPRPADVYSKLLVQRIEATNAKVYLINTGWAGGALGQGGERFPIAVTRKIVDAARAGQISVNAMQRMPGFDFLIPRFIEGVDSTLLDPMKAWQNTHAFKKQANELIGKFQNNFQRFSVSDNVSLAGPKVF